jgi:hypothetical protein
MTDWYDARATATIRRTPDQKFDYIVIAKQPFSLATPLRGASSGPTFYMSVDIRQLKGTPTVYYGLAFHEQESPISIRNNYYLFGANDAHFLTSFKSLDGAHYSLVSRRPGAHTRAGEINRLAVRAEQTTYSFFINDEFEGQVDDVELRGGQAAIAVSVERPDDEFEFEFGNFEVRTP